MSEYGTFSIRVMDENDNPVEGKGVTVFHFGFMGGFQESHTDEDGWVTFERFDDSLSITEVYVGDKLVDSNLSPSDGDTFSYTI